MVGAGSGRVTQFLGGEGGGRISVTDRQPDPLPLPLCKIAGAELRRPIGKTEAFPRIRNKSFLNLKKPLLLPLHYRMHACQGGKHCISIGGRDLVRIGAQVPTVLHPNRSKIH